MSIEQNIENLEIRNANVVTFVGTSSTIVDTISGRIQCKGFQHNSNVITDISGPHGRGAAVLKKYPEIAFEKGKFDYNDSTNTYVQAGYTVSASSFNPAQEPYRAFDYSGAGGGSLTWTTSVFTNLYGGGDGLYGTVQTSNLGLDSGGASTPQGGTRQNGEWIKIQMPNKIIVSRISISRIDDDTTASPEDFQLYGSNDGTTWVQILSETGASPSITGTSYTPISTPVAYKYFGLVVTRTTGRTNYMTINDLVFYGYEEDPPAGDHSVDTTFKSRFNNPQLTGVQVFVDGKGSGSNQIAGGPTVTDTVESYDETGKYWNLTGELTSNISVEANTFLEGDQPHAVSVWFNSSNLEANVSNTCVFSISDQEKLDSVNLDLQSNTWHNLTYSYQGEGGSRVTYLDGRKVAEDQAEDTFGDYPPFAMTGYSQSGYVASQSSEYSSLYHAWEIFNNADTELWISAGYNLDGTPRYTGGITSGGGGVYQGPISTDSIPITGSGSEQIRGEYIQLEFPYKFKLEDIAYQRESTYWGYNRLPYSGSIVACNDGVNWKTIHNWTGLTDADVGSVNGTDGRPSTPFRSGIFAVDKDSATYGAYKFFRIICTRIQKTNASGDGSAFGLWSIVQLELYGHRENDLVRFPDPTNVLKYPHIAMTGPAQRGYVASASGAPASGAYESYHGFNGLTVSGYGSWHSESSYATSSTRESTTSTLSSWTGGGGGHNGAWLKIQLPHKLVLSSINIRPRTNPTYYHQHPRLFSIVGSNDDTNWYLVHEETTRSYNGATGPPLPDEHTMTGAYASTAWKYFAIVIRTGSTDNIYDHVSIGDWELYGTEEGSVPIQIGGGNIDKVANFRVYDKFVGEDQALEIWNAQKDEFGRAKPQMVLQQGKLGIGTDAPQGSLSVADEPDPDAYGLQRIPPKPASGYDTYIEGYGVFQVSTSSDGGGTSAAYWAFDHDIDRNNHAWRNNDSPYTSGTWNSTQTASTTENSNTHVGHWIQLYTPVKYSLKSHKVSARASHTYRQPYSAVVLGSTDGSTWNLLDTWTTTDVNRVKRSITIDNTTLYNYFRLVVKALENNGDAVRADLGEWELYGIREQLPQKQSVLHDGQLTLTKNLDVPRIGPAIDADNTPRRDRLVVEYNTSTNPTFEGAVRDTSGRRLDGVFTTGASYDAIKKALTFNGATTSGISIGGATGVGGDRPFSVSLWFNASALTGGVDNVLVGWGAQASQESFLMSFDTTNNQVLGQFYGNAMSVSPSGGINLGNWYHAVLTYPGGGHYNMSIYVNGVKGTNTNYGTNLGGLVPEDSEITIGTYKNTSNQGFNGSISNFKLYDTALTASEVKTLYDMGRCDEGHHVVNFSKTRVGIGLGDGEAPTYTLDVRGQIRSQGSLVTSFTGQHKCVPEEPVEKGLIVSAKKNRFVKLNGGPITGKSAITIDESLPVVSLSNVTQDKSCFGVVSSMEEANTTSRIETTDGGVISIIPKTLGDNRAIVNSVGEGAIWVVNTNGSLESGDYITTSNVPGYGQKQDGAGLMNYTVAKITMDCDFTASNVTVQTIKREETGLRTITEDVWNDLIDYDRSSNTETQYSNTLVPSAYLNLESDEQLGYVPREVITIIDYTDGSNTISVSEWSNLIPETQNTYQSNTFTEIVDYTKFVSTTEWSNFTTDVQNTYSEAEITTYYHIQRGENVLDENGQLQWEDKTGATEAPYERRFLTADGTQTDEANAVHIAAFVGCTYHCG